MDMTCGLEVGGFCRFMVLFVCSEAEVVQDLLDEVALGPLADFVATILT